MKTNFRNEKGSIIINEDVIAKIAGLSAIECFGIVGMTTVGVKEEIAQILKREHLTKGVRVRFDEGDIVVDFHIIVAYGVSIATVCQNLLSNVTYSVEQYTGMNVKKINVYVDGVRVID